MRSKWSDIQHRHSFLTLPKGNRLGTRASTKGCFNINIGNSRAIPEEDDDIIDLEKMEIVQDRGVLRRIKKGGFALEGRLDGLMKGKIVENNIKNEKDDRGGDENESAFDNGDNDDDEDEEDDELSFMDDLTSHPSAEYLDEKRKRMIEHEDLLQFMKMETIARQQRGQEMNEIDDEEWLKEARRVELAAAGRGNEVLDAPPPTLTRRRSGSSVSLGRGASRRGEISEDGDRVQEEGEDDLGDEGDDEFEAFVEDALPKKIDEEVKRRRRESASVEPTRKSISNSSARVKTRTPSPAIRSRSVKPLLPPSSSSSAASSSSSTNRRDRIISLKSSSYDQPPIHTPPQLPPAPTSSSPITVVSRLRKSFGQAKLVSSSPLASRPVISSMEKIVIEDDEEDDLIIVEEVEEAVEKSRKVSTKFLLDQLPNSLELIRLLHCGSHSRLNQHLPSIIFRHHLYRLLPLIHNRNHSKRNARDLDHLFQIHLPNRVDNRSHSLFQSEHLRQVHSLLDLKLRASSPI